jgi:N-acetylneuraminic acid mutarotase
MHRPPEPPRNHQAKPFVLFFLGPACALLLWLQPALGQEGADLGEWTRLASAPTKRTEVVAATVGGKIYLLGGFAEPALGNLTSLTVSDLVAEYDPATDHWSHRAPLPIGLHHAGAATVGGKLYVIGGFTTSFFSVWQPVASVFIYDPVIDRWTEGAPMPTKRGALAVAELDGKLVAIGGYDGTGNSASVEVYDPADDRWIQRAPLPTPRDHLAAVSLDGKLYTFGGRLQRDYGRNLAVTEVYDPSTDRWTKAADLPTPRSGITAGALKGIIYVLGGEAPEGTFRTNEAYDPSTDRWRTMAPMPTGRHGLGSAVVNGRLYALSGGPTPGGSFSDVTEAFLPPASPTSRRPSRAPRAFRSGRAPAKQVGAVMAILATFQDAEALPPESSPEANQLIKALIQFQAAFMKSDSQAVWQFFSQALTAGLGDQAPAAAASFQTDGWTSRSLEAVIDYEAGRPLRDQAELQAALGSFNVGASDFDLLSRTFTTARRHLISQGQDLHRVYEARRREMPGSPTQR